MHFQTLCFDPASPCVDSNLTRSNRCCFVFLWQNPNLRPIAAPKSSCPFSISMGAAAFRSSRPTQFFLQQVVLCLLELRAPKKCVSLIDASHSQQPLVEGERLGGYEVNAVMTSHATFGFCKQDTVRTAHTHTHAHGWNSKSPFLS